jgi:hypothetical protein
MAAAPGGYAQPLAGYPPVGPGYPPVTPGYPPMPASYPVPQPGGFPPAAPDGTPPELPEEDTTSRHGGHRAEGGSKRRAVPLLVALLVVVLGAGAYYAVPKYVLKKSSTPTSTTVAFPATIGSLAKTTDSQVTAAEREFLATLRPLDPALSQANMATYGPAGKLTVLAGLLPASVKADTAAQQIAILAKINNLRLPGQPSTPDKLKSIPQSGNGAGQWWCGAAAASDQPATDCIAVDSKAVVMVTVAGSDTAANIALASQAWHAVELH